MLIAISALKGYAVEASDGPIGTVGDILFDDRSWMARWLVVETGAWLKERKVLVHPSAVRGPDHDGRSLPVTLTKAQVEGSPSILDDQPVSMEMQSRLDSYYGSDPIWGSSSFGTGALAAPLSMPAYLGGGAAMDLIEKDAPPDAGDPHLRSIAEVIGYHIHASDGSIGHVENFLIDDGGWDIRYLIVDTRNWWPGQHVLISPYAVTAVRWSDGEIRLDVDRETVKSSPPWDPIAMIDQVYAKKLHRHYEWPGYGF